MMAAYAAAESGHAVTLLEQNEKLGKKLFITGKGRCNLTNASDMEQLFANVVSNRKFLYSAFYSYDNEQVVSFFESHGMPKNRAWEPGISRVGSFFRCDCGVIHRIAGAACGSIPAYKGKASAA